MKEVYLISELYDSEVSEVAYSKSEAEQICRVLELKYDQEYEYSVLAIDEEKLMNDKGRTLNEMLLSNIKEVLLRKAVIKEKMLQAYMAWEYSLTESVDTQTAMYKNFAEAWEVYCIEQDMDETWIDYGLDWMVDTQDREEMLNGLLEMIVEELKVDLTDEQWDELIKL